MCDKVFHRECCRFQAGCQVSQELSAIKNDMMFFFVFTEEWRNWETHITDQTLCISDGYQTIEHIFERTNIAYMCM